MGALRTPIHSILFVLFFIFGTSLVTAAPVAYWPFDEGNGTTVLDASGNGNTGTFQGSPTWTSDSISGYALQFDGIDDKIFVPYSPFLQLPTLSISAWIKRDSSTDGTIISRNGPYYLQIYNNKLRGGVFSGSGSTWTDLNGTTTLQVGVWYHVGMTYDGNILKLFVNGQEETSAQNVPISSSNSQNLYIAWGEPGQNYHFHGIIDEIIITNDPQLSVIPFLNVTNIGGGSGTPLSHVFGDLFETQFSFQPNSNFFNLSSLPPETVVGTLTTSTSRFAGTNFVIRYYGDIINYNTPVYYNFPVLPLTQPLLFGILHFNLTSSPYQDADTNGVVTIDIPKSVLGATFYIQGVAWNGNELLLSNGYSMTLPLGI